jgi:hypothetical protein
MADSATTRNRARKQSLGSNLNVWGDPYLNDNLDRLDESLDGQTSFAFPSGTSTTLTSTNYAADQARMRWLILTGTATANGTAIIPGVQKYYHVINLGTAALGSYTLTMKTASGVGASVPAGYSVVQCDATDTSVRRPIDWGSLEIINVGAAASPTSVARYNQVTTAAENRDMGGYLLNSLGTATAAHQAANKGYVDAVSANIGTSVNPGSLRVTSLDGTAGYLGDKLLGTLGVTLTTNTGAGTNLSLSVGLSTSTGPLGTVGSAAVGTGLIAARIDHRHDGIAFGRHTVPFLPGGLTPNTTNGPARASVETGTAMVARLDFDTATIETAQFDYPAPKSWDLGGMTAKFTVIGVGTGTGAVVFGIDALAFRGASAANGAFIGTGTYIGLSTLALVGTGTYYAMPETGTFIAAGTAAAEDILKFRVRRIATDAGDTFTSDVGLVNGRLYLNINAPTDA